MSESLSIQLIERERSETTLREPPAWLVEEITRAGGTDISRPNFRVIWGGNRFVPGPDGLQLVHPYRTDMWHLERLMKGEYEHCFRLGECPVQPDHRAGTQEPFCKKCYLNGGIPIPIEGTLGLIRGIIVLLRRTEDMQRKAVYDAGARNQQKDALFGREEKKADERKELGRVIMAEAMPKTVKRSFETPMRLTAQQALGRQPGIKQMNAREIARGLRKQRSK